MFEMGNISQRSRVAQEKEVSPQTQPDKASAVDTSHQWQTGSLGPMSLLLSSLSATQRSCKHSNARINSACGVWDIVNSSWQQCLCLY